MIEIGILIFIFFIMKSILVDSLPKNHKESRKAGILLALSLTAFFASFMQMVERDSSRIAGMAEMPKYEKEIKNECK